MSVPQRQPQIYYVGDIRKYSANWTNTIAAIAAGDEIASYEWEIVSGVAMLANSANGTLATTVTGTVNGYYTTVFVLSATRGIVHVRHTIVLTPSGQRLNPILKWRVRNP